MEKIITRRVRESLQQGLTSAAQQAQSQGKLSLVALPQPQLEVPNDKSHGNFASNLALVLAKEAKMPPRQVAELLLAHLPPNSYLDRAEVAGPGFINFHLNRQWLFAALETILTEQAAYGTNSDLTALKVQLEFVSANPVGPMNIVNARAAALGDCLGNLLAASGAQVEREYYVNDFGNQLETLGRSLEARYRQQLGQKVVFPEDGYQGQYLIELADKLVAEQGETYLKLTEAERVEQLRDWGCQQLLAQQQQDLANYGIVYDRWFSERSLHESGAVLATMQSLVTNGLTFEAEGALWLRTTDFGDDKDRVLRTADGRTTYFTADIAYHLDKFQRGFDRVIDIWGPDHHGYIARMKAALTACGLDPDRLEVLIAQQINLLKEGQPFKMSKRRGEFITMADLLEEVGNDAARWFFLMRSADSPLDFDLDLAKSQSNENPVYYVQYAHARINSIFRQAAAAGLDFKLNQQLVQYWDEEEAALLEQAAHFPDLVSEAAQRREPQAVTNYLLELAGGFHSYYNKRRFISEDLELSRSRLAVARGLGYIFQRGLGLLGISAPERM